MTGYESKRAAAQAKTIDEVNWLDHEPNGLVHTEQEPVSKLQEPTAERAWFTIAELNAWADKKLSENPHWVMPKDEPERDEPPQQRPWVGLTEEEQSALVFKYGDTPVALCLETERKLKEMNNAT